MRDAIPPTGDGARVLVLAPTGRDAEVTCELLAEGGITSLACADDLELCREMEAGASCALVAEEALRPAALARIAATLARQPAWSDFPFVMLAGRREGDPGETARRVGHLGNVTVLERPMKATTMLAAVHGARRTRRRQYEARRAIESRDQFLAMLGHELRNPLSVILFAADLLKQAEDPAARERQRAAIDRQSKHLARLVDDLLDVARVSYGKITLHREPLDLAMLLRATVSACEPGLRERGLEVTLDVPDGLWVHGDRVRLEQVFGNLLSNAMKYTPRGGRVRVEAARERGLLRVSVIDTGIGIEPAMCGRVFDLFTQVDRSLDRSQGGMGVGLTVVRNLVRLHGGEVEAHSEGAGRGCELRVRIPLLAVPSPVDSAGDGVAPASTAARARVVVVEDIDDVRMTFREMLESAGHAVWTAVDGPQGVARILEQHPDVAFIDIGLPGFDGYEVARRVRANGGDDVLLVAVTGYGQNEDRTRARGAGFEDHMTKPVDFAKIAAILANHPPARRAHAQ